MAFQMKTERMVGVNSVRTQVTTVLCGVLLRPRGEWRKSGVIGNLKRAPQTMATECQSW